MTSVGNQSDIIYVSPFHTINDNCVCVCVCVCGCVGLRERRVEREESKREGEKERSKKGEREIDWDKNDSVALLPTTENLLLV